MNSRSFSAGYLIAIASLVMTGPVAAQTAPPQAEVLNVPAQTTPAPAEGPQWRAFSRGTTSTFQIDPASVSRDGDEIHVSVARVPLASPAGDYSHVIDDFAVRCERGESRLTASADAYEDGAPTEAIPVDEPWGEIRPGSFDEGIKQIGCGEATPVGAPFPSIRAYIDAGRP